VLQTLLDPAARIPLIRDRSHRESFLQGIETRELLARIRAMRIGVSIDDFGTAIQALLPANAGLDTLKIDKVVETSTPTELPAKCSAYH